MNDFAGITESRHPLPRALALAAASAILMTLAVPNEFFKHGFPPLGFIALVPLYIAILDLQGPKSAALVTGIYGALQHGLTSFWLWFFKDFRLWTLGSTVFAYFIVYSVLGLYLWLFLRKSGRARPLAFAVLWVSFEYLKSTGFLGYPWGLLPYSMTEALPLLQIADLAGLYGVTAVLAGCNAALAELCLGIGAPGGGALARRDRLRWSAAALAILLCCLGYGLVRMGIPVKRIGSIDAVLVQQNSDPWEDDEAEADRSLATSIRLAREAIASAPRVPDIVLFSETTLLRPYAEFRNYYGRHPAQAPLIPFIKDSKAWLFTGAPIIVDWETFDATNSAILIDPQTKLVQSYAKLHPVPFAEAIPFWEVPAFREFIQKKVGLESGWVMGTEYSIFTLPAKGGSFRFGAPICFEDAFADVCREFSLRDADLLINLTNISWSKTESAEIQHWAAARFRAIEARKTLVRSTNGGVSCVVGPYGETIDSLPLFEPASKFVQVPVYRDDAPTVYIRWGDWFAHAALLLSAALSIILIVRGAAARRAQGR